MVLNFKFLFIFHIVNLKNSDSIRTDISQFEIIFFIISNTRFGFCLKFLGITKELLNYSFLRLKIRDVVCRDFFIFIKYKIEQYANLTGTTLRIYF